MEIEASSHDRQRVLNSGDSHPAAEMLLTELPFAVYVKLDQCNQEFLPPIVCQHHQHAGFAKDCDACRASGRLLHIGFTLTNRLESSPSFKRSERQLSYANFLDSGLILYHT